MTTAIAKSTACVTSPDLFLHPLLEEGLPASASGEARQQRDRLAQQAKAACTDCPLLARCLYDAIIRHDVSGFVAGTTPRQRLDMRQLLRWTVEPEDFDTMAGASGPNRQVDHTEVLRLRAANPHESLEMIAQRLGCSLSTVKRHLRKARNGESATKLAAVPPSVEQVMAAYDQINRPSTTRRRAA